MSLTKLPDSLPPDHQTSACISAEAASDSSPATSPHAPAPGLPGGGGWIKPILLLAVIATVFAGLFVAGFNPGLKREQLARESARQMTESAPVVATYTLGKRAANSEVELPGNTQPLCEVPIFARTSGFLKHRLVDIGDRVTTGQLLAEVEDPETDQQLKGAQANVLQAKAAILQAESKLALARTSYAREDALVKRNAISQEEADQSQANYTVSQADLEAAKATLAAREADVARLVEQTGFQQVKSPIAGIVTLRNVDEGALINVGTGAAASTGAAGSNSGRELFRVSDPSVLRVYVNVPQRYSTLVTTGVKTLVRVPEITARPFAGDVIRTANSVDSANRTMLAEVQIPNSEGKLLAGMYAQVKFLLSNQNQPLVIPSNALVVRPDGLHIAVVSSDRRVSLHKAEVGRDYGTEIELLSGGTAGEQIVTTPPDDLADGSAVELATAQKSETGTVH